MITGNIQICPTMAIALSRQYGTTLVQHENSCYELLHNKVTWSHGESLCQQAGGHLAHINSAFEQNYIDAFMAHYNPNKAVWIGLHDRRTEGHFEWTSGLIFMFSVLSIYANAKPCKCQTRKLSVYKRKYVNLIKIS